MSDAQAASTLVDLYPRLLQSLEEHRGGPFVAGLLLGGRLVGAGTNTVLRDHDVTRHAEMNALADAGHALSAVHLDGAVLVTSHLPCLMCWHAAKWARVRDVYYVFDYAETESIFGFHGDARFLADLGIAPGAQGRDPALRLHRVATDVVTRLYRGELPRLWDSRYRARLLAYDV